MGTYAQSLPFTPDTPELGDDIYAKCITPYTASPWLTDQVIGEPIVGQTIWMIQGGVGGLDTTKAYMIMRNIDIRSCTVDDMTDVITAVAHGLTVGTRIYLRGVKVPDETVRGQPYWVDDITTDTFTLRANEDLSGGVVSLGAEGSGVQFVATSYRSISDEVVGRIDAREVVETAEGEAIDAALVLIKAKTDLIGTINSETRW